MRLLFYLGLVKVLACISLDQTSVADIFSKGTVYMIKTSSPSTGFVWYLLSEDTKVTISDADGVYNGGDPGYQNFTAVCSKNCKSGDNLKLSLILKRPWEDRLFIMKTIELRVVDKTA